MSNINYSVSKSSQGFIRTAFLCVTLLLSVMGVKAHALDMAGDEKTKTFATGWLGVRIDTNQYIFICQNGKFINNHCYSADSVKRMAYKGNNLEKAPMLFLESYLESLEKRPVEVTDISYPAGKLLVKYKLKDEGAAAYVPPEFNDQTVYYPIRDENGEKKEPSPLISAIAGLVGVLVLLLLIAVMFVDNLDPIFNFFERRSDRSRSRTRSTSQLMVTTTPTQPAVSSPATTTEPAPKSNDDKPKPRKIFI